MNNKVIIALAVSAILTTPLLTPVAQANPQAKQAAYLELLDQQILVQSNKSKTCNPQKTTCCF